MPTIVHARTSPAAVEADIVAVFVTQGDEGAELSDDVAGLAGTLEIDLAAELAAIHFEGEAGAVARIPTRGRIAAPLLLVTGLGKADSLSAEGLRKAAGAAARGANKDATLAIAVPAAAGVDRADAAQAVTEGAGLGAYAFTAYRSKNHDSPSIDSITVLGADDDPALERGVETGRVVVRATALARDLVNEPPGGKRPPALAQRMADIAGQSGLRATVWDEDRLADEGFGGVLGVGQGSSAPPRFVEIVHEPPEAEGHVVLVGKGITFDSGGLSLKPSNAMTTMKSDMSGAAAVIATMSALPDLDVRPRVTGLVALAENMPSGTAIRVSDVITHRGGKTVEVMNTDAEGRLVLADALAYGAEQTPDAIIDLATLTGAQVVALGKRVSAVLATDDDLADALLACARDAGEGLWRLPLVRDYAEQLKSPVADLKNIGKPMEAGTIIGALFLQEFVGDVAWAHLDIAGPAFSEDGDKFYTPKGGTGAGVRTLLRYLHRWGR